MRKQIQRYYYLFIRIGAVMMVLGWLWPFFIVIKVLKSTFFSLFTSYTLMVTGGALVVVGVIYDHFIDRKWD